MKEELQQAILAHGQWKVRLESAIATGKSEFRPETVKPDNNCVFGKWFYGLPESEKNSKFYAEVKDLHAQFHLAAAKVLELAIAGKPDEAMKLMTEGEYIRSSAKLILALGRWLNSVQS